MTDGRVIVFLKAPRPGFVKTRIAADLDAEAAVAIYQALVGMTLSHLRDRKDVELRFTPDDAAAEMVGWRRPGWSLRAQGDGDLGERLLRAVEEAFSEGVPRVVLLGGDCPELASGDVEDALVALSRHDVVLGPAVDGGYWLMGLRRSCPDLFRGIAWGTDRVCEESMRKAAEAGLTVAELRRLRDIDSLADWRTWLREHPL
ncbi:MAG: TIGR04282 family arsenosugar biosynthesis glycosyltransferase [Limisphaerales bacterium]